MKKSIFLVVIFFSIRASAQQPYYDFKKFRENNLLKDPNGTFILPLDKNKSIDSLRAFMGIMQKVNERRMGTLVYTQSNGTRVYVLPQDHMACLVPDMSQFNMPVMGKEIRITGMPPGSLPRNNIIPEK